MASMKSIIYAFDIMVEVGVRKKLDELARGRQISASASAIFRAG
jgi:hypothetical protein